MGDAARRSTTAELLPEGTAAPAQLPPPVFTAALATFLEGRRLDMQALAAELGWSRSTLYRKVRDRDQVLSDVIWYLSRRALHPALVDAESSVGSKRVLLVLERFMTFVSAQPAFRRFLEAEPEAALRVLTSKRGDVQRRLIALTAQVLREEDEAGTLRLAVDPDVLAFVIVRIGESFLYADVIADNEPDLSTAFDVIAQLLPEPEVTERRRP
jgi:AcrR family transcriptional regulator